ncbi:MAG: hypothetical protein NT169_28140 [Chloroflexi bacterium]|nr:hypothetical protein [Chloroflexota bacterium]
MPVHTAALVMKAAPGAELACRAHNLPPEHPAQPRGLISYYATAALVDATTVGDWLARIQALVQQDIQAGRLPRFYRPDLCALGDSDQPWAKPQ